MAISTEDAMRESKDYFGGDELAASVFVNKYALRDNDGNLLESTPTDMHHRLAKEFARIEAKYPSPMSEDEIFALFDRFQRVIPQGSPMSAIGNNYKLQSSSNCFVLNSPYDSYSGIMTTDQQQAQIMKRRGGVGFDISTLRPRGMMTQNAAGTTDGIGIFMERFSNTCREVAQCIAEGQRVLLRRGLTAIEDVESGDLVWTRKGWVRVGKVLSNGPREVVKVTMQSGLQISTTGEHIFAAAEDGGIVEKRLKSLEVGDSLIVLPGTMDRDVEYVALSDYTYVRKSAGGGSSRLNTSMTLPTVLDEGLAYFLGYSYGDGSVERDRFGEPRSLDLACSNDWPLIKDRLRSCSEASFAYLPRTRSGDGDLERLAIGSKIILGFLEVNGLLKSQAEQISIPNKIWRSKPSVQNAFIAGFFDADGHASGSKKGYVFTSVCAQFIRDVQTILLSNGIASKIHVEDRSLQGWRDLYSLCVVGKTAQERFVDLLGQYSIKTSAINFISKRDCWLTPYLAGELGIPYNKYSFLNGNDNISAQAYLRVKDEYNLDNLVISDQIVSIDDVCQANTYDLCLDEEHLFWCEGLYVHNSGRRGALLLSIDCHHPEIRTFINIKRDLKKVTGANISVRWSDEFLTAVERGERVQLRFPVGKDVVHQVEEMVDAKQIWDEFVDSAYNSAEPGCLYWNTAVKNTPADIYADVGFGSCSANPCAELILAAQDSCRLITKNTLTYVMNPFTSKARFDFESFKRDVIRAQRLMDDLVDLEIELVDKIIAKVQSDPEPSHIKQIELDLWNGIRAAAANGRRTGLGVTAIGDTIAALGICYGSKKSISVVDEIYRTLALGAYESSIIMAKERGTFPVFSHKKESGHPFLQRLWDADPELHKMYLKHGRRNIALTTTAPTGSVSTMTQTSSGIEPVFMTHYKRRKKINPNDKEARVDFVDQMGDKWQEYVVYHHGVAAWMMATGKSDITQSPYHGATANEIDWEAAVDLQAAAQKWVCHAISKTTNLPSTATKEDVHKVYWRGWKSGCKGMTVYRDGCRSGVLVSADESKRSDSQDRPSAIQTTHAPKRPDVLPCDIHHVTIKGTKWVILVGLMRERPYEMFAGAADSLILPSKLKVGNIRKVKHGTYSLHVPSGDDGEEFVIKNIVNTFDNPESAWATRMISMSLRHGVSVEFVVEQLNKDGNITDINKILSRVLKKYIADGAASHAKCRECGSKDVVYAEGCLTCKNCSASKCG